MSTALERARAAHAALACARAAPDPGDVRMVSARAFANAVEAIGGYTAAVDPDKGGSVYVTVSPGGFKARFADHGGFFDFTISVDPVTGNTVADAVALFKHAIDPDNPLPGYQTSSIDPPTGRQFSAEAEFNRNAYLMGRNPSSRKGQSNEAPHAPPKGERSAALLDAIAPAVRAMKAAALARLAGQYRAGGLSPLERLRIAQQIRALVVELGGGAVQTQESDDIKTLRAIAAGSKDGLSLAELFGTMQEAINALTEADALAGEAETLAHAAITRWAELESMNVAA